MLFAGKAETEDSFRVEAIEAGGMSDRGVDYGEAVKKN